LTSNAIRTLAEVERETILDAIAKCDGNHHEAARQLGIGKTTIWRKLHEYGERPVPVIRSKQGPAVPMLRIPSTAEEVARVNAKCPKCGTGVMVE
jgi:hypothetical protein